MAKFVVVRIPRGYGRKRRWDRAAIRDIPEAQMERYCRQVRRKFPEAETYIIDAGSAEGPPEGVDPPRGHMWCPYCREHRKFVDFQDVPRCEVCGISDRNFHVRLHNGLFARMGGKGRPTNTVSSEERKRRKERRERRKAAARR